MELLKLNYLWLIPLIVWVSTRNKPLVLAKDSDAIRHRLVFENVINSSNESQAGIDENLNKVYRNTVTHQKLSDKIHQLLTGVTAHNEAIESTRDQRFTRVEQLINKLNRGVMEYVLLLPEINKRTDVSEQLDQLVKGIKSINVVLSALRKPKGKTG